MGMYAGGGGVKFEIGQAVYVGWCPDHEAPADARSARCSIGFIQDGPFDGTDDMPSSYVTTSPDRHITGRAWIVAVDGDSLVLAKESMLSPFRDPTIDIEELLELTE